MEVAMGRRGWGFCFGPGDHGADDLLNLRLQMRTSPPKSCPYPLQPPIEVFFRRAGTPRPGYVLVEVQGRKGPCGLARHRSCHFLPEEYVVERASGDLFLDQAPQIAQVGDGPPYAEAFASRLRLLPQLPGHLIGSLPIFLLAVDLCVEAPLVQLACRPIPAQHPQPQGHPRPSSIPDGLDEQALDVEESDVLVVVAEEERGALALRARGRQLQLQVAARLQIDREAVDRGALDSLAELVDQLALLVEALDDAVDAAVDVRAEEARDAGVALVLHGERERGEVLLAVAAESRVEVLQACELLLPAEARADGPLPELAEEVGVAHLEAAERARVGREADDVLGGDALALLHVDDDVAALEAAGAVGRGLRPDEHLLKSLGRVEQSALALGEVIAPERLVLA